MGNIYVVHKGLLIFTKDPCTYPARLHAHQSAPVEICTVILIAPHLERGLCFSVVAAHRSLLKTHVATGGNRCENPRKHH